MKISRNLLITFAAFLVSGHFLLFSDAAASAFNSFDNSTFSNSTCDILKIEQPRGIFASPSGNSSATGSYNDPIDLQTALSVSSPVEAGETLWLLEGTYKGSFVSELRGTESAHITIKPYPGIRAILDSEMSQGDSTLTINGEWTDFFGLEILSSDSKRVSVESSSSPSDITLLAGVTVFAPHTRVINFIIHDTAGGFSFWTPARDSELYGNIIYNNGWTAPDRGHGHAIYTQNDQGYKKLDNNIIFFGFGTGIHAYGESGKLNNFSIEKNVWYMTGASDPRASQLKDNCLVGGAQPVQNLLLKSNLGYSPGRGTRIGYYPNVANVDATFIDNYLVESLWLWSDWQTLSFVDNHIYGTLDDQQGYITASIQEENDFQNSMPTSGKKVFIHENTYDQRRARLVIYNYDESDRVAVDVSSILQQGESYRVHSVFDLFGKPILTGVYGGRSLTIPMGTVPPPQPNGLVDGISEDDNPKKKFGVFIITHAACADTIPVNGMSPVAAWMLLLK